MITPSNLTPLFAKLTPLISGEIDCSPTTISVYSTDMSPYAVWPQAIIYPKNIDDIKQVVIFARKYNIPITTKGNGSRRNGGSLGEGIILDMSRYFNNVQKINSSENTVTVGSGISIKSLREKLKAINICIPILTTQENESSAGGFISTKSTTASSFAYGTAREWVESIKIILDDGEEYLISDGIEMSGRLLEVYQNILPTLTENEILLNINKPNETDDSTGYCLWNKSIGHRLLIDEIVGGEGTLGIVTSITFKTVPHKPNIITTCIPVNNINLISSCISIAKHHKAEHIFLFDKTTNDLIARYHINLIPKLSNAPYVLLVTHYDIDKEKLNRTVRTFTKALPVEESFLIKREDEHLIDRLTDKNFLFSLLDSHNKNKGVAITTASGIIVPPQHYDDILKLLNDYLSSLDRLYIITGNAGSGHISVISLFDPQLNTYEKDTLEYTRTIFDFVKKYKGGISAIDGEGLIRTPFLSYVYNENVLKVFKKIKEVWDPHMVFNPDKKTSVTTQYLHTHLIHPKIN